VPNACVMYNRYRFEMRDAGQPVDPQVVQRYRYLHALMMEGSPEKAEAFLSKSSVDMSKQRGQTARMSNKTAQSESEKPDDGGRAAFEAVQLESLEETLDGMCAEALRRGVKLPPHAYRQTQERRWVLDARHWYALLFACQAEAPSSLRTSTDQLVHTDAAPPLLKAM
jgi:hypothetical protein